MILNQQWRRKITRKKSTKSELTSFFGTMHATVGGGTGNVKFAYVAVIAVQSAYPPAGC